MEGKINDGCKLVCQRLLWLPPLSWSNKLLLNALHSSIPAHQPTGKSLAGALGPETLMTGITAERPETRPRRTKTGDQIDDSDPTHIPTHIPSPLNLDARLNHFLNPEWKYTNRRYERCLLWLLNSYKWPPWLFLTGAVCSFPVVGGTVLNHLELWIFGI